MRTQGAHDEESGSQHRFIPDILIPVEQDRQSAVKSAHDLVRGRAPTILPVFLLRARSLEPRYKYIMVPLDNDNRYSRTGNLHFSVYWYRKS